MKPLKKSVSVTLDDDILELAKIAAEEEDRSLSSYINLLLRQHLRKKPTGENKPQA